MVLKRRTKQSLDGLKAENEAKFGWSEGRGRSEVWMVLKRRTKRKKSEQGRDEYSRCI